MPNILKTRGIVLRTYPFKESSLFCSIFSEKFGKLNLLAKGARRPKSKLCGTLEPFNHSEIIFYKREFKDTYTLSDATIIDDFESLRSSPAKVGACESICEFINKTQTIEDPNPKIYSIALSFFNKLCPAEDSLTGLWTLIVLFKLLKFAGFEPHLLDCVVCHKMVNTESILNFSIAKGGLVCEAHFDASVIRIDRKTIETIAPNRGNPFPDNFNLNIGRELKHLFETYIYYHLHGLSLNALRYIRSEPLDISYF